ncbi:hypothetical protein [Bacillus safensis]|uniref:hypothetical protein n=1 Tax=Bacillus safensis TaxID=561879 RepID=UPI0034510733
MLKRKKIKWSFLLCGGGLLTLIILLIIFMVAGNFTVSVHILMLIGYAIFAIPIYLFLYYPIKPKRDNLYLWLDSPYGRDEELICDLSKIPVNNTLENLDKLSRRLMVYADFDIKKLRLLRAYFRTLHTESQSETFFKKAFAIFCGPVIIYVLNNFDSFMLFNPIEFQEINPIFLTFFNIFAAVFYLCGILFAMIRGITTNKKRNRLIEEVIDACIINLKD